MQVERVPFKLKGMDDRSSGVEPGWAERIVNLTCDATGAWRNCTDWWWMFANTNPQPTHYTTTQQFQSMYWWPQRGTARQWLIWERATSSTVCNLEVFDGMNKSILTLSTTRTRLRTPDPGSTYLSIGGWLYIVNGYDQPVRWNGRAPTTGSRLVQIGFDKIPPPPDVTLGVKDLNESGGLSYMDDGMDSGVGVDAATWRYGYAVTWLNDVGAESPPSPVAWVSGTNPGSNEFLHVKVRMEPAPEHVRAVRLYRTVNMTNAPDQSSGARFSLYHVRDIPASSAQAFLDGLGDIYLGHELDEDGTGLFPVGVRYAAYFKGTLFVAGCPSYPDRVFYSAPGLVEQFPTANTFDMGGAGGEVMGLHATQNALVVFLRRGVYVIKGDPINGFYLQTISSEVGCIAPGAVVDLPGERPAVMFFDIEGPYILIPGEESPASLQFMGERIRNFWRDEVNVGAMMGARAARNRKDEEILFTMPTNGVPATGQMMLVYHYIHGWWSLRNLESTYLTSSTLGAKVGAMCEIGDHRGIVAVGSDDVYVSGFRNVQAELTGQERPVWQYRLAWQGERTTRRSVSRVELVGHLDVKVVGKGGGLTSILSLTRGIGIRWREDRKVMPELDFTGTWNPANNTPVVFDTMYPLGPVDNSGKPTGYPTYVPMVESEYSPDTWEYGSWDTGVWEREVARVYAVDIGAAGYEVQFEIAGGGDDIGPVVLTHGAFCYTGGAGQDKWSFHRAAERP